MERELPTINIEGTDFIVDVTKLELREKSDQKNIIPFEDMRDVGDGYTFEYSLKDKNLASLFDRESRTVKISEFVILDPIGMANKYNHPLDGIKYKSDFDLMVNQQAYDLRVNKGVLPTVDIDGHTFYVDIRMDMLRPKDDFLSKGIVFNEIDHYFSEEKNTYLIPYDPKKHEFRELDYDNLVNVPKDLIAVEFPFQKELDPIGWNRNGGWDLKEDLKHIGLKSHFQAKTVPWKETFVHHIIKDNLEKIKQKSVKEKEPQKNKDEKANMKTDPKKGKGRKM
ncbi:MAG: hypothetical protein JNM71_13985 [Flavobacterium lindanitolerans]|uniref:hypothetical protein n=1 Tax=Flavobacterium lindanitolerans TaxID=428988 RepID=UPI001A45E444|nr:hypothetical protein [Flavobacterium lindanitolerans]MBL7869122.1 hypothetical protein [Flavobacterium lindanitolerans]